ncbi:Short neuropeptide F, partial [Pseudolycoriella hygida]
MALLSNGMLNQNQPIMDKHTQGYFPMTEGVRWTEKYTDKIENIFSKLPKFVTNLLATLAIFLLGTSIQGEWILILVHFFKHMGYINHNNTDDSNNTFDGSLDEHSNLEPKFLFNHWTYFVGWAAFGSYFIYFSIGGFLHRDKDGSARRKTMNGVKSSYLLLLCFLHGYLTLAASSDSDSSINDLYENLLQREYTGPISFPNHQVERKAQRSPSLRLRFGRRSDPSMSLLEKRFSDEINQKPIRSPSLRLRFGKRDQSMYGDQDYFSNDNEMSRDLRAPSPRLRWGRRSDPDVPILGDESSFNELDVQPEKRKPVRLRWGRSYKSGTEELADNVNDQNTASTGNVLWAVSIQLKLFKKNELNISNF